MNRQDDTKPLTFFLQGFYIFLNKSFHQFKNLKISSSNQILILAEFLAVLLMK
jgi:hypothetical protein